MIKKIPCEIWSRPVGFFRPLSHWNLGKQEEFSERSNLKIDFYKVKEKHAPIQ